WPQDMGSVSGTFSDNLETPGTKLLCHPMYKWIEVNGIAYDYIPVCGLPAGFVDESVQGHPQSQSKQSPESTQVVVKYACVEEIESGTPISASNCSNNECSQISTDSGTDTTEGTINRPSTAIPTSQGIGHCSSTTATDVVTESTITMDQDVITDPFNTTVQEATTASISIKFTKKTEKTKKAESIIGSLTQTVPCGATLIIELSDEEEHFEVTATVPSKRRVQDSTSRGVKDSRTEANIHPKPHNQGTQDCPLEIESD
ncbi:hypothetical protein BG006_001427, partial [Podila minutissima]